MRLPHAVTREPFLLAKALANPRRYFLAKFAVLAGIAYLFSPVDLFPQRMPVFGHVDKAALLFGGLVLARVFATPTAEALYGPETQAAAAPLLFRLIGYRGWWLLRRPLARSRSKIEGLVLVGGAARSGTTMLRTILGRHPLIAAGPETTVFLHRITAPAHLAPRLGRDPAEIEHWQVQSRSQMEFIERFHQAVLTGSRRRIWVEKTPANVFRFGYASRRFPNARMVHIVRDGRDTVCSLRRQPWAKIEPSIPRDSPQAAVRAGALWAASVGAGLRHRDHPRYWEICYEELVASPDETLRRLIGFLDIPWHDALLRAPTARERILYSDDWRPDVRKSFTRDAAAAGGAIFDASIGRWRHDLSVPDRQALGPVIGGMLIRLGYERDLGWAAGTN